MAEQSAKLPVKARSTKGSGGNPRRYSTGQVISSESGEKILPHYLRASTGSCHDFCKYGRKHESEEQKIRIPFPKRVAKKLPDDQYSGEFQLENKLPVARRQSFPDSKIRLLNMPAISKQDLSTKSVDSRNPAFSRVLAKKKESVEDLVTKSLDSPSPVLTKVLSKKKKSTGFAQSHGNQSPLTGTPADEKTSMHGVAKESVVNQGLVSRENGTEKKTSSQRRKKTSVVKLSNLPDSETHLASRGIKLDVPSPERPDAVLEEASSKAKGMNRKTHANSLKAKISSPDSSKVLTGRRNTDVKTGQRTRTPRIAVKRVLQASPRASLSSRSFIGGQARGLASPRASLSSKSSLIKVASLRAKNNRGLRVASPLKSQKNIKEAETEQPKSGAIDPYHSTDEPQEPDGGKVEERTLYVIKMEGDNKYVESDQNENVSDESPLPAQSPPKSSSAISHETFEEFLSKDSEFDYEFDYDESEFVEDEIDFDAEDVEGFGEEQEDEEGFKTEQKGRLARGSRLSLDSKNDQPIKLRFRRGKVIEVQSENNGPRRLKFRRGRVLAVQQNLKTDGRKMSERGGIDDDSTDAKADSEKIILRHQDGHGKKDAQGLFNNVIEETASKLVETRKSKVKALVGAFETVISLQDLKPSAS
ncbi:hypothetical protein Tsubulata_038300 [Turnera subulata]|uniref:Calmodulin-binding domain-containing protein n=1 Tax=Turnera subulata TaxID=218843 RepID=A0A9Q0GFS5_9ROSI|nr:hypothetical protein Tsubulata_038300 [Turnera subulata]